jgi:hypothetical protein
MSNVAPKPDALAHVYNDAARERFVEYLAAANGSAFDERDVAHVRWLTEVLAASGPLPSDDRWAADRILRRRASRAALDVYVSAADACGLLDSNVVERLRSTEERNFRSAKAECLVAWFLAGKLGCKVAPLAGGGRKGKQVEFGATTHEGQLVVEVKASRVDVPKSKSWSGDDFKTLEADMRDASDQFGKSTRNLLVLVPQLRTPVYEDRDQLEKLIGERVMHVPIATERGVKAPPPYPGFVARGRFVRFGKTDKDGNRLPAHTRVSAVMSIECGLVEKHRGGWEIDHRVVVVHNPNAEMPIDPTTFGGYAQLVKVSETDMAWTDRKEESDDDDD